MEPLAAAVHSGEREPQNVVWLMWSSDQPGCTDGGCIQVFSTGGFAGILVCDASETEKSPVPTAA